LEENPSAAVTIYYIKRMYIYVHLPPFPLPHPPCINTKWLDYCADARRLSSFEHRQVFTTGAILNSRGLAHTQYFLRRSFFGAMRKGYWELSRKIAFLCNSYDDAARNSEHTASNDWMILNNELEIV
jgi:hypothetical protein